METSAGVVSLRDEYDASLGYHPAVPPLDVRLGLTPSGTRPEDLPPLRWGILSCGKAAHDFAQALKRLSPHHAVAAVAAARCSDRARSFASLHGIPRSHGSYADLCSDPTVDVVYVASLHPQHREHAELALRGGKHVLVEKPMCMTAEDAEALYDIGKRLGLFVGEGMWTRFFPAVEWARRELERRSDGADEADEAGSCDGGAVIGPCRVVQADFCIDGDDVGPYPDDSIYRTELGGGTVLTMGCYVIAAAMLPFRCPPDDVSARGILPADDGVSEVAAGVTLIFDSPVGSTSRSDRTAKMAGGAIASTIVGYMAESTETTQYAGKGGRITLHRPAHCPTSATRRLRNGGGRREVGDEEKTVQFPLPPPTPSIEEAGGFKMPNSMGFIYEAEAVRRLVAAGERTFPQWTPEESVGCLRTIETIREQISAFRN